MAREFSVCYIPSWNGPGKSSDSPVQWKDTLCAPHFNQMHARVRTKDGHHYRRMWPVDRVFCDQFFDVTFPNNDHATMLVTISDTFYETINHEVKRRFGLDVKGPVVVVKPLSQEHVVKN